MALALYDNALVQKLSGWTKDTNLQIYGPDAVSRLFEMEADEKGDRPIQLPLIGISRNGGFQITNQSKRPMTFDGFTLDANLVKSIQLNCIPITIEYQIDIYTRYLSEADEIARNLIFNIINYPKITINIPYNDYNYVHYSNIRLSGEVQDNSSIPERLSLGQFTRLTLNANIDDAYLWDTRVRNNVTLEYEVVTDGGASIISFPTRDTRIDEDSSKDKN